MFRFLGGETASLDGTKVRLGIFDFEKLNVYYYVDKSDVCGYVNLESGSVMKSDAMEAHNDYFPRAHNEFRWHKDTDIPEEDWGTKTGDFRGPCYHVKWADTVFRKLIAGLVSRQVKGDEVIKGLRAKEIKVNVKIEQNFLGGWMITKGDDEIISMTDFLKLIFEATQSKLAEKI